jgi:hypothetical protein
LQLGEVLVARWLLLYLHVVSSCIRLVFRCPCWFAHVAEVVVCQLPLAVQNHRRPWRGFLKSWSLSAVVANFVCGMQSSQDFKFFLTRTWSKADKFWLTTSFCPSVCGCDEDENNSLTLNLTTRVFQS